MSDLPLLLPMPREMTLVGGTLALPAQQLIVLDSREPLALTYAARRLQGLLRGLGLEWEIVAGERGPRRAGGHHAQRGPAGARGIPRATS